MSITRRDFIAKSGVVVASSAIPKSFPIGDDSKKLKALSVDRLVLLGVQGGPFIRSYSSSPAANLIEYREAPFIIDTGYGITFRLLDAKFSLPGIKYIFITHHHSDHNLELGPLLYNSWLAGLSSEVNVYGPTGLNRLLESYWESNRFDIETRIGDEGRPDIRKLVIPHEIKEGEIFSKDDVVVFAMRNIHPPVTESFAYKFVLGKKIVVFSGDTAYCPPLAEFARNADLLVHEVMYGPAIDELVKRRTNATKLKKSLLSHHTLTDEVGKIATQANVKTLVLNHFVPPDDKSLTDDVWKNEVGKNFNGKIIIGKSLMEIPL